jgi:hypothetical protein
MRLTSIGLLLLLSGCAKTLPPVVSPTPSRYPVCKSKVQVMTADICMGNQFTAEGYACADCRGGLDAKGCLNEEAGVYCVATDCLQDLNCRLEDVTAGESR